uniref:Uncharacterized protein n=1 Tax=Anguilla anguilla TaxID=7936 RepID=A0A0E9SFB9_ANGAN
MCILHIRSLYLLYRRCLLNNLSVLPACFAQPLLYFLCILHNHSLYFLYSALMSS